AGGLVLAAVCFYLFREPGIQPPVAPNHHAAVYYSAGALTCVGLAWAGWPRTGLLLYPALSLCLAALAYCRFGSGIYRKENGRIPLSSGLLLAPVLAGHWLSLAFYRRQCEPWNPITPQVWIGSRLNSREATDAKKQGLTAVLDLTAEFSEI